ncbi:hypothetical protein [Reyranella sp. CPCC 100927]|uniref:hypothetical protein n=1 Tax=Reyranella sp. CPCC 100927 TaxID=2599616 RepID=UPI0011B48862|nr:hypothetical protein [Reyranella sp. CPCC 100927]TWT11707.1 hypothetical protein FQU96_14630 [Reyranella sp. CPCC 100927]
MTDPFGALLPPPESNPLADLSAWRWRKWTTWPVPQSAPLLAQHDPWGAAPHIAGMLSPIAVGRDALSGMGAMQAAGDAWGAAGNFGLGALAAARWTPTWRRSGAAS